MLAFIAPGLPSVLGVLYFGIGGAVAWQLHRQDPSLGVTAGALVAWPVFLPLLAPASTPVSSGPMQGAIDEVFCALRTTLRDPAVVDVPWEADLQGLQAALVRSDERLALVDRLLAEETGGARGELEDARARSVAEIQAVLDEVVQLRIQIGLAALAGDNGSVRDQLAELLGRVRALDEVTRFHG
jgi:hypothetical protein